MFLGINELVWMWAGVTVCIGTLYLATAMLWLDAHHRRTAIRVKVLAIGWFFVGGSLLAFHTRFYRLLVEWGVSNLPVID